MYVLKCLSTLLHAVPFTIVLLACIIGAGIWTKIYRGALSHHWIERFGFAPKDLWNARLEQLFFSLFFTNNRRSFIQAIVLIVFAVGGMEWNAGTLRAALTFWGIHATTLIVLSFFIIFPLHKLKTTVGKELALVKDVGPSAGYFGCLGFMTRPFPFPWPWLAAFLVLAGLLIYSFVPPRRDESFQVKRHADWAHIIAFVLGVVAGILWPIKTVSWGFMQ